MSDDPTAITVRPAVDDDIEAVARLAARLVRLHHSLDPLRFLVVEPLEPGYAGYLRSELAKPRSVIMVATAALGAARRDGGGDRERVVGYAYGRLEPRDWFELRDACGGFHDVFVEESVRERGVGRRLALELVRRLEALGAPRVVLKSAWRNEPAQRLFESIGFRRTMVEMTRERG